MIDQFKQKIAQLICKHYFSIPVDLDGEKEQKIACDFCRAKFQSKVIPYRVTVASTDGKPAYYNACGKRRYASKKLAQTVLNRCKTKKRKQQPTRVYECPQCNGWHLTSK